MERASEGDGAIMTTSADILARMTPSLVASTLERIADDLKDGQEMGLNAEHYGLDVIHLRQIADWAEARQKEGQAQ